MFRRSSRIRQYGGAGLLSLALHAAAIGSIWVAGRSVVIAEEPQLEEEPISFELVEETALAPAVVEAPTPPPTPEPMEVREEQEPAREEPEPEQKQEVSDPVQTDSAGEVAEEEHSKVVSEPKALNHIAPRYPRSARRNRREGAVTVEFEVGSDGRVTSATVVGSSGYRDLDEAAVESARKATFAPATEDGAPVAATLRLTFEFRLK